MSTTREYLSPFLKADRNSCSLHNTLWQVLSHALLLAFTSTLQRKNLSSHFTDKKTKAQRDTLKVNTTGQE